MSRSRDLDDRLKQWGHQYSRRVVLGSGGSWLASLMRWHGRAPTGLVAEDLTGTQADEVEQAVQMLERQRNGQQIALVLRAEFMDNEPRERRLRRLQVSTVRYSQLLRLGRIHVAGWLRLPFDEPLPTEEQVAMLEYVATLD